jgi:hypothetical protein
VPAAAAAILVIALLGRDRPGTPRATDALRAGGSGDVDAPPALAAFGPADGDTVPRGSLRFVWAGHGGQPLFHLTVTDPAGRALWLQETSDTSLAPPRNIALEPGRTYYWYVDAVDENGGALTTGPRHFTLGP